MVAFGGEREIYLFTYILLGFYHWFFFFSYCTVRCYLRVEKEEEGENPPRERERERDLLGFYADNTVESERRASHII